MSPKVHLKLFPTTVQSCPARIALTAATTAPVTFFTLIIHVTAASLALHVRREPERVRADCYLSLARGGSKIRLLLNDAPEKEGESK